MKTYVFRLAPGADLRQEIDKFVLDNKIKGGCVLTCVGNLQKAILRMADASIVREYEGTFEIVSLVGTVESGNSHLHISISDKEGHVFGGHLKDGSIVGITAEVVIADLQGVAFKRVYDESTGYKELVIDESE